MRVSDHGGWYYSYAAFAGELEATFGASRASVSVVYALCGFAAFTISAVSGPLADRIGPRPLAMAGMGLVAVGLFTAATARTLVDIDVCYGLVIGLGIGFAYVPAIAAVQRWFVAWRGLASGMAAAGIGVGTANAVTETPVHPSRRPQRMGSTRPWRCAPGPSGCDLRP